jgi:exopolysaccharide production protein ExoQ
MPSTLALLLCFIFILALLVLDSRKGEVCSAALWIPTLWMLICGSRMVSQWFSFSFSPSALSADSYADGSPLDRNIFLLLIMAALAIVVKRGISVSKLIQNNRWMCLFLLYCAISIAWSDFPEVSFKRYIKEIGNLLMVLVVLSERVPVEAIRTLVKRCAYVLIPLSIALYRYFPRLGRTYGRWSGAMAITGVTNNKNSLGVLCAICGIGLFWSLLSMWRGKSTTWKQTKFLIPGLTFALTVWVLMLAKSATSVGCFLVGVFIVAMTQLEAVRRNITLYALSAVCVIGVVYMTCDFVALTAGTFGRDETLTGRTEIWHKTTAMVVNPLVGNGYSSFWLGGRMETLWREYSWHPTEAHDGYLDIYLDLGVIGIGLLFSVITSAFRAVLKFIKTDFECGVFQLAILTAAVLYNITESAFRPGLLMYFFFTLAVIRLPRRVRIEGRKPRRVVPRPTPVEKIEVSIAHFHDVGTRDARPITFGSAPTRFGVSRPKHGPANA